MPDTSTYNPAFALPIHQLLRVCKLGQEVVRGVRKLGCEAPLAKYKWTITQRCVLGNAILIYSYVRRYGIDRG